MRYRETCYAGRALAFIQQVIKMNVSSALFPHATIFLGRHGLAFRGHRDDGPLLDVAGACQTSDDSDACNFDLQTKCLRNTSRTRGKERLKLVWPLKISLTRRTVELSAPVTEFLKVRLILWYISLLAQLSNRRCWVRKQPDRSVHKNVGPVASRLTSKLLELLDVVHRSPHATNDFTTLNHSDFCWFYFIMELN